MGRTYALLRSCAPLLAVGLLSGCDEQPASPQLTPVVAQDDLAFELVAIQGAQEPFADLAMFFEFNATDNDLGVQVFLDAEGWDLVSAKAPDQRSILQFMARNQLGSLGITELRFESAEPSPAGVLARFPAGPYAFRGRTVERGMQLVGVAYLSHDLPPAPVVTPDGDEDVDPDDTVIRWNPIPGLAGYEVIVSNEDNGRSMTVEMGPDATSLRVPAEFMEAGAEYKAEVLSIYPNGNKTITEVTFATAD